MFPAIIKMDVTLLNKLNLQDYPDVLKKLHDCKDKNEACQILNGFEHTLDDIIMNLERNVDPQQLLDELHRYNDMKDMTQAVIGTLANIQGDTIAKVHEQFNVILD